MRKSFLRVSIIAVCVLAILTVFAAMFTAASDKVVYSYVVTSDPVCAFSGTVSYPSEALRAESIKVYGDKNTYYTVSDGLIVFNGSDSQNSFDFTDGKELISVEFTVLGWYDKSEIKTKVTDFYSYEQYIDDENEPFDFSGFLDGKIASKGHVDLDDELQSYTLPDEMLPTDAPEPQHVPGDVNGDGSVGSDDVDLLQQYVNKWDVAVDEDSADVNKDGMINMKDIVLIQQYINNLNVVLE